MASGIKASANRPKSGKNLRSNSKKKRLKNESSEKQAAYKAKIAARRSKKNKR